MRRLLIVSLWAIALPVFGEAVTFRVMTYNLGLLTIPFKGDAVKDVAARAKKLPDALAKKAKDEKLDLIVLQEVWDKKHADAIAKKLEGFTLYRPGPESTFIAFGHGLAIAVRDDKFKIEKKEYVEFKERSPLEKVGTMKGFLAVTLSPPLVLITSHMQVLMKLDKDGNPLVKEEAAAQGAQIDQLADLAGTLSEKHDLPVLFAGDTNCGPVIGKENYEKLGKAKAVNAVLEANPKGLLTWDKENPLVKSGDFKNDPSDLIDHVLYWNGKKQSFRTKSCKLDFKEENPLSDHYATICELVLE